MSDASSAHADREGAVAFDVLYVSARTRVFRPAQLSPAGAMICKEYLGSQAQSRLRNEKAMLARLSGIGGVVQMLPGTLSGDVLGLQDCGGIDLAQVIRSGRCDLAMVLALAPKLARTLAQVHRAGVIHGDFNPANILISGDGEPLLIDFDLAVLAESGPAGGPDGLIVGTLAYLAPEQTGRTGHGVDQRADLYSLGVTLYELATGRLPFEAQDTLQLIHDHLVREPIAPVQLDPGLPRGLSDIILRLLEKAPERRYQSGEGLLHDLTRFGNALAQQADSHFALGEYDFPQRLAAPVQLVGREHERSLLRAALADALRTPRHTVLIEGGAGVGKSVLISDMRPMVTAAGGWLVHGKFDQHHKDGGFLGAVTQVSQAIGRLLLTLPAAELAVQRQRILDRLGRNAGLITRASAEFALLLGAQPAGVPTDPQLLEPLMLQATVDLLGAVASAERPLVIAMEDLHWAGAWSLRVFSRLMDASSLSGLLLIGSLRPEEVGAGHPLLPLLAQWQHSAQAPLRVALANLPLASLGEMVGQMLRLAPAPALELAAGLHALTDGNPFDTVEMVNALRRDNVLKLGEAGWQWDDKAILHFVGRGNVVDLLAARVDRLPQASRDLLECMSCLGNVVARELLRTAACLTQGQLLEGLFAPLEDGLLVTDAEQASLGFRHDRVQEAVLGLMDDARRLRRQLAMARQLAQVPAFQADAAQQYLASVAVLQAEGEPPELRQVAHLFQKQAQKFAATATYVLAERYLAAASRLLATLDDPADAPLRWTIDLGHLVALCSLGRLNESDTLYASIEARATDPMDLVDSACLQMRSLYMRGQAAKVRALGLHMLTRLGLEVPADFIAPDTQQRLDALAEWVLEDSRVPAHARLQMTQVPLLAISRVLGNMARPVFDLDRQAFVWLMLECQRLWTRHGACRELVATFGRMGGMLISLRADYRTAFDVARHALKVGEAMGWTAEAANARFLYCAYAGHWFEPLEDVADQMATAYKDMLAGGDVIYAGYAHVILCTSLLEFSPDLQTVAAEADLGVSQCRQVGNLHAGAQHACVHQLLRALRGQTRAVGSFDDANFNEQAFLASEGKRPYIDHSWSQCRAMYGLLIGDAAMLIDAGISGLTLIGNLTGYYLNASTHFHAAMARAWQLRLAGPEGLDMQGQGDRAQALAELETSRSWLAARAADQPYNFLYMLRLVEAERDWALGDLWKASAAFDSALAEVAVCQRPWHRALITERAGLFHSSHGHTHTGNRLLTEALAHYQAWGAAGKVAQMLLEHEFLKAPAAVQRREQASVAGPVQLPQGGSVSVTSDALDLVGVLRASQALSSETGLEPLVARVTEVLESLSGATRVLLLLWHDEQWWLLAPTPGEPAISERQAAERGLLPLSVLRYAHRTNEPLVLDDAPLDNRFAGDPYFGGVAQCSLLVTPIASQSDTRAMLYLENRLSRAAFSAQRLDAVMLVAGQLAVSLANAQLYESLERRVQVRTRELEHTQAQLVATARRAGKAEIANNVLHNVGNVLNSVNVSASVVRRTIGNSRVDGLARAVALMNDHQHDLAGFMDRDARGQALLGYLNQLVGELGAERENALGDLDRLSRSVEHITYVVANQQSHAGPSSVVELVQPQQLLQEAVQLGEKAIEQAGVTVVLRCEEVTAIALDRQRLLQILVNLISNSAQAMQEVPVHARQLTLAAQVVSDAAEVGNQTLRVTVKDSGEGISQDNLKQLFAHGFTTRTQGHGFGLHSSALAAMEMGAKITAHSDGPGLGAVFVVELPIRIQQ